jgi:hypothetical protein
VCVVSPRLQSGVWEIGNGVRPCLAGLQKELRLHAEPCQTVWSTAAPGVKLVLEPQGASTEEVEPRKRGSIRLHLPFTVLPPAVRGGGGAGQGATNGGGGAAGQRRGDA